MFRILSHIKTTTTDNLGYSTLELDKIAKLYDIVIKDDLLNYLLLAGRSTGCLFKNIDYELYIPMYTETDVRSQILFQEAMRNSLQEIVFSEMNHKQADISKTKSYKYFKEKPFFLSVENQTQYFFILTEKGGNYPVYQYDENEEKIYNTKLYLADYLKKIIDYSNKFENRNWLGEMIIVK